MKSIGAEFYDLLCPSWCQPHAWDALSNRPKHYILGGSQLIQLYKFVCRIPTQNININLHSKSSFSYDIPG